MSSNRHVAEERNQVQQQLDLDDEEYKYGEAEVPASQKASHQDGGVFTRGKKNAANQGKTQGVNAPKAKFRVFHAKVDYKALAKMNEEYLNELASNESDPFVLCKKPATLQARAPAKPAGMQANS